MTKKVLLLVAGDNGTIGSCSLNLYEALKAAPGVEVKCVIIHHFADGYSGFSDAEYYGGDSSIGDQIKWLKGVKRDYRPDVTVSTLFGVSTLSVLSGGNDKKVGIFHSPHTQIKAFGMKQYMLTLLQYSFLYPRLDKLCCVSSEVRDSLSAFPWIRDSKKSVVYNVHNTGRILDLAKETIEDPEEREIMSHPTVVYCGRLDRNKAPIRSIEAFAKASRPADASLVFIGNDEAGLEAELQTRASELGIGDRVYFFGRKSNPYPFIGAAKALISSSYSEGLPGVMIEALTLGVPVVTTNSSRGIWEIFSCPEKYDAGLSTLFESECGIISSNLSRFDSTKYDVDIANLVEAIGRMWHCGSVSEFAFHSKIEGATIVNQLLAEL